LAGPISLRIKFFSEDPEKFQLVPDHPFCAQVIFLSPQEYKELKGDGPFTVFVPHADLISNMSQVYSPGSRLERDEYSGHGRGRGDNCRLPLSL
jgi:hypothetical protein